MLTGEQIRAARALVRLDQKDLAARAEVSLPTIKRLEKMDGPVSGHTGTITAIQSALESAGVVFLPSGENKDGGPGVRLRRE